MGDSIRVKLLIPLNKLRKESPVANAESNAAVAAVKLVTAGLQSSSIKLLRIPTGHAHHAEQYGKADAAYLKALITGLTQAIKDQE